MTNEYIEGKADALQQHFFEKGATVSQADFDFAKDALTETWNKSREQAYAEFREKIATANIVEDKVGAFKDGHDVFKEQVLSLLTNNQESV